MRLRAWTVPLFIAPLLFTGCGGDDSSKVKLRQQIPVHIVYFTAWADDAGTVRLVPDVYGYDAIQSSH
jgi:murein L,D-transpeptidase YcbB/YkuD